MSDMTPYYKTKIMAVISLFEDATPYVNFTLISRNGGTPTTTGCCFTKLSSKLCSAFLILVGMLYCSLRVNELIRMAACYFILQLFFA